MVDFTGVPCPTPNCQGYLKLVEEDEVQCEFGHMVDGENPIACPVPNCKGFLKAYEENSGPTDIRCEFGHLVEIA